MELWARNDRKWRLARHFWVLLHAVILRHGTDGFTFPPKEAHRGFFARKIRRIRPGLNQRTWVPKASTLPPDHRSRYIYTNLPIMCVLIQKISSHSTRNYFFKFHVLYYSATVLISCSWSLPFGFCDLLLWTLLSHFVVVTSSALLIIILTNDTLQLQQNFITDINLSHTLARYFNQIWSQSEKILQFIIG